MAGDTIRIMNYALAVAIKAMNPDATESFVEANTPIVLAAPDSPLGEISIEVTGEVKKIHLMDESEINQIKSKLIWYLCFSDEIDFVGSVLDEFSSEEWDTQESNLTLIDGTDADVEMLYTIVDTNKLDRFYQVAQNSEEWLRDQRGEERADEVMADIRNHLQTVRENADLRIAYFYDF